MASKLDTSELLAAVSRLTGDDGRPVRHGRMFRVEVISSDGERCGVPIQVDDHRREPLPYVINEVADCFLIRRGEIHVVLERGTRAELRDHLSQYTQAELKPPHIRHDNPTRRPFWG